MKRIFRLTGAAVAAVMAAAMAFSSFADTGTAADNGFRAPEAVLMDGTVISVEEGRLYMNRRLGDGSEEVVVTISEDTRVLDGVNGYPIPLENLGAGEAVRVYTSPAMTMSLPPMTNGIVVLCDVPADGAFPSFGFVEELKAAGNQGEYTLTMKDGGTYTVKDSTVLLPYLTRNIVMPEDLVSGTQVLVWPGADGKTAEKIVIFPDEFGYGFAEEETEAENGWKETSEGWYFYDQGQVKKGWLYEGEDWYFLDPQTGLMKTGFVTVDGRTYFLKEDGRMLTEAAVFVPDENGALHIKTK